MSGKILSFGGGVFLYLYTYTNVYIHHEGAYARVRAWTTQCVTPTGSSWRILAANAFNQPRTGERRHPANSFSSNVSKDAAVDDDAQYILVYYYIIIYCTQHNTILSTLTNLNTISQYRITIPIYST